jgi:hypothetical protein
LRQRLEVIENLLRRVAGLIRCKRPAHGFNIVRRIQVARRHCANDSALGIADPQRTCGFTDGTGLFVGDYDVDHRKSKRLWQNHFSILSAALAF